MPYWVVRDFIDGGVAIQDGLRSHHHLTSGDWSFPIEQRERNSSPFLTLEEAERFIQGTEGLHIEPDEEEVLVEPKVLGYVWSVNPTRPDFYAIKGGMGSAIIYESKEAALAVVQAVPNLTHSFLFALTLADAEPLRAVAVPKTYTLAPYVESCDDSAT